VLIFKVSNKMAKKGTKLAKTITRVSTVGNLALANFGATWAVGSLRCNGPNRRELAFISNQ
jgi:hypothetical protein